MIEELRTLEEKLVALPVYTEVVNFDTGEQGDKHARVPIELLKSIFTALTAAKKLEVAKEALRKSQQGWENVVEMGILPPRHWETANNLSNDCLQALAALEAK